jgi:uncharacterized protein YbjT (DUF2867 family)
LNDSNLSVQPLDVFVTGGTGYMGRRLVSLLVARGHRVRVLARQASMGQVPADASAVMGDALDPESIAVGLRPGDTVIHLVGTPHPNPAKAKEFERVDLASIRATVTAACRVGIAHLVYVSVAQPAPVMRAYLAARGAGEAMIREAGVAATILRPWYVLGPGHWWPAALIPFYKIAEMFPRTRGSARRVGLVTLQQMVNALACAAEDRPAKGEVRIIEVPAIRRGTTGFAN